jgi:3-dehydroquinate dehydratase II
VPPILEEGFRAIVLNPGALTHYSIAVLDAVRAQKLPVVEVHLSNIHAREEYRRHSLTASAAKGLVSGFGPISYKMALMYISDISEILGESVAH